MFKDLKALLQPIRAWTLVKRVTSTAIWQLELQQAHHNDQLQTRSMANRGYDVVVDVDQEVSNFLELAAQSH